MSPFLALQEDLSWFIECGELRVLHIATGATERTVVVEQVARIEGHPKNRSPFFMLEDAHPETSAWLLRADRTRVLHDSRRAAMAQTGYQLGAVPPPWREGEPIACFAAELRECLAAQQATPELAGIMLVLAPTAIDDPKGFTADLIRLLRFELLAPMRVIVIEVGEATTDSLLHAFGDTVMRATCKVDPEEQRRNHAAAMAAVASAPIGASPEVRAGFAGPRDVAAPPRYGKPPRDAAPSPEVDAHLARELGPLTALTGSTGAQLKQRIFGAAAAVQEGRFPDAIRLQTEARDQCLAAGVGRLAGILEISLGAYLLQGGRRADAHATFEASATRAAESGMFDLSAQALLGLGAVLRLEGNLERSAVSYERAGEAAERANAPHLAIEAYRTAGQIALEAKAENAAIAAWQRALAIAQAASPGIAATSSAPAVARALAKVMRDRGSPAAQSLIDQADAYERAPIGAERATESKPGSGHVR